MNDDLTWQQLQAAIGVSGAISIVGGKVIIDPSLITGDTYDNLADKGVIEFVYKLHGFAYKAQTTMNQNATAGNRLNSFSTTSFGTISQDTSGVLTAKVTGSRSVTAILNLDEDNPIGSNV